MEKKPSGKLDLHPRLQTLSILGLNNSCPVFWLKLFSPILLRLFYVTDNLLSRSIQYIKHFSLIAFNSFFHVVSLIFGLTELIFASFSFILHFSSDCSARAQSFWWIVLSYEYFLRKLFKFSSLGRLLFYLLVHPHWPKRSLWKLFPLSSSNSFLGCPEWPWELSKLHQVSIIVNHWRLQFIC